MHRDGGHVARKPKRSPSDLEFPVFAPFRDFKGNNLEWYQPSALRRHHELTDRGLLYADMQWLKAFGSLAMVESSEGAFTLKRGGFLSPYVTVRDAGFDTDYAVLRPNFFSGGNLTFSDGRQFTFTSARFWGFEWSFKDDGGATQCSLRLRSTIRDVGDVVIPQGVKRDKRLMATIAVAYYAMVMANDEAAVIAVAAT
jgi:hypothetical protein